MQDACQKRNIPVWCGGMLESGIGRAHNIAMSTLAGFSLPGDVSASQRYWTEDIIEPEVEVTAQGNNPGSEKSRNRIFRKARSGRKSNRETNRVGARNKILRPLTATRRCRLYMTNYRGQRKTNRQI